MYYEVNSEKHKFFVEQELVEDLERNFQNNIKTKAHSFVENVTPELIVSSCIEAFPFEEIPSRSFYITNDFFNKYFKDVAVDYTEVDAGDDIPPELHPYICWPSINIDLFIEDYKTLQ